jgi:hypothetical protein
MEEGERIAAPTDSESGGYSGKGMYFCVVPGPRIEDGDNSNIIFSVV